MIWWYGGQYKDKQDALAQGAYDNDKLEMLPLPTCRCCGENDLEKLKSYAKYLNEWCDKFLEKEDAKPKRNFSRASQADYSHWVGYEVRNAQANMLNHAISVLEGKSGCL
jgi:hypothetical protein